MPAFPALPAAVCALAAVLLCARAAAQQKLTLKRVTLSSLTAQGFEVKAALREAVILQKGAEIYWCNLRLAESASISYQSDCFSVH